MATLFSIEFLLIFWMFFIVYWLLAPWFKLQNVMLLLAGYFFVWLSGINALLVLLSWSLLVWGLVCFADKSTRKKTAILALSVLVVVFFAVFKYYASINEWLQINLEALGVHLPLPVMTMLLPLGMSFYLFNSISMVMSVIDGKLKRPDVLSTFLYVNFIPTLIAGPVNNASELLPQISGKRPGILEFKRALLLIALALVKLFLLSSWLNDSFVTGVFELPEGQTAARTLIAIYGWAWNIYFNFSGYSDLVTGLALLLGFRIARNFSHPYQAANLKLFWRNWHMSLSSFILRYIYIPLGGSRGSFSRTQINLMLAMIISGIWHGAGFNFFIWGALHGAGLVIYNLWEKRSPALQKIVLPDLLARLITFHFVCFAWIFFRAGNLPDACSLILNMVQGDLASVTMEDMTIIAMFTALFICYPWIVEIRNQLATFLLNIKWYALPLVIIPVLAIAFFFAPSGVPGFIYANF